MAAAQRQDVQNLSFANQLHRYVRDPGVALWRKLVGLGAALYVISPIDIVPDFIPLIGWLDDLGILGAFAAFMVREVRKHNRLEQRGNVEIIDPPPRA